MSSSPLVNMPSVVCLSAIHFASRQQVAEAQKNEKEKEASKYVRNAVGDILKHPKLFPDPSQATKVRELVEKANTMHKALYENLQRRKAEDKAAGKESSASDDGKTKSKSKADDKDRKADTSSKDKEKADEKKDEKKADKTAEEGDKDKTKAPASPSKAADKESKTSADKTDGQEKGGSPASKKRERDGKDDDELPEGKRWPPTGYRILFPSTAAA